MVVLTVDTAEYKKQIVQYIIIIVFGLFVSHLWPTGLDVLEVINPTYYSNVVILPVVTLYLPISSRFSPYEILSRRKFSTMY